MKKLLSLAEKKHVDLEIFNITTKSTTVEVIDKNVEAIDNVIENGLSIRIIKDNKLGFAYSTDLDESSLEDLFEQAINNSINIPEDKYLSLPIKSAFEPIITFDREISDLSIGQKTKFALSIEAAAYKNSMVKKTEKVSFSTHEIKTAIINTNGIDISYFSNYCGGSCDVIAEAGNEQESGYAFNYVADFKNFIPESIGNEAASRASKLLSPKSIPSQRITLILDPFIGAQLLGSISSLFFSDSVQKGKSLFANKLGQYVASSKISITDDGRLKGGLSSAPVDDEGVSTGRTKLIEDGKLCGYLYNSYYASKDGTISTGNGKRSSYKSLPEISPSNIYIMPGEKTTKDRTGLYITRVMGMHTVNPISGDFSIGAAGIMITNGQREFPVRGITIAGNLIDLLKSVEEVGNDLRFFPLSSNFGSPTLVVSDIAVSG